MKKYWEGILLLGSFKKAILLSGFLVSWSVSTFLVFGHSWDTVLSCWPVLVYLSWFPCICAVLHLHLWAPVPWESHMWIYRLPLYTHSHIHTHSMQTLPVGPLRRPPWELHLLVFWKQVTAHAFWFPCTSHCVVSITEEATKDCWWKWASPWVSWVLLMILEFSIWVLSELMDLIPITLHVFV